MKKNIRRGMLFLLAAVIILSGFPLSASAESGLSTDERSPAGVSDRSVPEADVQAQLDAAPPLASEPNADHSEIQPAEDADSENSAVYTVTFKDWDGSDLGAYTVSRGQTSPVPMPPSRSDYAFIGWNKDLTNVQGNLTVTAKYRELKKYTATIYYQFANGGVAAQSYVAEVKEGYTLNETVASPAVVGYRPDQTSVTISVSSANEDKIYTVVYTKESGVVYKVNRYQEGLTPGEYALTETDSLFGETGGAVRANPKDYPGFDVVLPLPSGTISADGSLSLNVYYKRKVVTVEFDTNGGSYVEPVSGRFGEPLTPPCDPARPGHTFGGWNPAVPATFPAVVPVQGQIPAAQWTPDAQADYLVLYWLQNPDDDDYTMFGVEVKTGTAGAAPELPDPASPFSYVSVPFPDVRQLSALNGSFEDKFYKYNETKTIDANKDVAIDAEKSAFVNVYFDRQAFTLHFVYSGAPVNWAYLFPDIAQLNKGGAVIDYDVSPTLYDYTGVDWPYQVEVNGQVIPAAALGVAAGGNNFVPADQRTWTITGRYMEDISGDVPRIRYIPEKDIGAEKMETRVFMEYYNGGRSWRSAVNAADPLSQPPLRIIPEYVLQGSSDYFQGYENKISFFLNDSYILPTYRYTPMFEPIGGGVEPDRRDYIEGSPVTVMFYRWNSDRTVRISARPGFKLPVPSWFGNPWYGGIENADYQWPADARTYYKREKYTLAFYDGTNSLNQDAENIWYEEPLAAYDWTPPVPVNKPGYTFKGWYTSSTLRESARLDFSRAVMPAGGMILYAKWQEPVYQVTFDLNGGAGVEPTAQDIGLYGYINPPVEPTRDGYIFVGWKERNRTVAYKMDLPVNRDLDLVADWAPEARGSYTVYYLEAGTDRNLGVAPKTVTRLETGSSHTETAEGIVGYLPDTVSKSLSVNVNPVFNSIIFYYKAFKSVNYNVHYETLNGETLLPSETKATGNIYVTDSFKKIPGYYPAEEQITLQLSMDEAANQMVFRYLTDGSAAYTVNHHRQNLDGITYTLVESEFLAGQAGASVAAVSKRYTGFNWNSALSVSTGSIPADGSLILEMYYDRQPLTVTFTVGKGGSLRGARAYTGILWGTPFERATRVPTPRPADGYAFTKWTPTLPTGTQPVTQDAQYTALFEKQSASTPTPITTLPPVQPTPPAPETRITTPASPAPGTLVVEQDTPSIPPASVQKTSALVSEAAPAPVTASVSASANTMQNLTGGAVPLVGFDKMHWSIVSLLLSIIAVAAAFITLIRNSGKRRREEAADSERASKRRINGLCIAAALSGLLPGIVFLILDDMRLEAAWFNQNTIWVAIGFVIFALVRVLQIRHRQKETAVS